MIVAVEKVTGRVISSSSHNDLKTEKDNAISCGLTDAQLEVKEVTEEEFRIVMNAQPKGVQPPSLEDRVAALEVYILKK